MQANAIDTTLNKLVNELPKSLGRKNGGTDFQALIETLKAQIKTAIDEAVKSATTAGATTPSTPATPPTSATPATAAATGPHATNRTTSQLTPSQQSLLKNQGSAPLYELLSNELTAASPLYNEREALMRQELDLDGIERHLKSKAGEQGVEYDRSDLEGILRNSGYGAAHLGSTERYMAAVQKFIGEAENNYRQRANNIPGSRA